MKAHRRKRLGVILFVAAGLSVAIGLTLYALSQNIDLFYTPTQVAQGEVNAGQRIRIGGMVREGSVQSAADSLAVRFVATDYANDVPIYHEGILPDLFRLERILVDKFRKYHLGICVLECKYHICSQLCIRHRHMQCNRPMHRDHLHLMKQ